MRGARGFWILVAIAGVVAVVVANVALLGLATERNDPVGRLQPLASLDLPATSPRPAPSAPPTTTGSVGSDDDHGGPSGGDERDD